MLELSNSAINSLILGFIIVGMTGAIIGFKLNDYLTKTSKSVNNRRTD